MTALSREVAQKVLQTVDAGLCQGMGSPKSPGCEWLDLCDGAA